MAKTYRSSVSKRVRNMYAESAGSRQHFDAAHHQNNQNRRKNAFDWQDELEYDDLGSKEQDND